MHFVQRWEMLVCAKRHKNMDYQMRSSLLCYALCMFGNNKTFRVMPEWIWNRIAINYCMFWLQCRAKVNPLNKWEVLTCYCKINSGSCFQLLLYLGSLTATPCHQLCYPEFCRAACALIMVCDSPSEPIQKYERVKITDAVHIWFMCQVEWGDDTYRN